MTTKAKLNIAQEIARENDGDWEDHVLDRVDVIAGNAPDWYSLGAGSMGWNLSSEYGVEPKVGDTVRVYGHFGRPIVGQDLNGEPLYYKTEREREFDHAKMRLEFEQRDAERFEERRADLDAAYDGLPDPFQKRLDRFRAEDPTFRYSSEGYESFILVEAAKIAEALPVERIAEIRAIEDWKERSEAEKVVTTLDTGAHSGNTWGAAWAFAERLLRGLEV